MSYVEVKNIYKIFGKNPPKNLSELKELGLSKEIIIKKSKHYVALNNVSFNVEKGEVLVIMGLSGCGKSTLIRCINRLIEPTYGSVIIDGNNINNLNKKELLNFRKNNISMIFQRFSLLPHKTVLKNVEFGLEVQGMNKELRVKKASEALDLVGLKNWSEAYPRQLSGGMQQRVGLARALAVKPQIMLMDEAFSALDPLIRCEMQDELILLQKELHKTIIFVTHDLDEAIKLGDRIIIMKDGEIVQQGTAKDILRNPCNEYVEKFVESVKRTEEYI